MAAEKDRVVVEPPEDWGSLSAEQKRAWAVSVIERLRPTDASPAGNDQDGVRQTTGDGPHDDQRVPLGHEEC